MFVDNVLNVVFLLKLNRKTHLFSPNMNLFLIGMTFEIYFYYYLTQLTIQIIKIL